MKVIKFGGSSISSPERIKRVLGIINSLSQQEKLVVVVSAFGGVTEKLIEVGMLAAKGQKAYLQKLDELREFHISTAESVTGRDNEVAEVLDSKFKDLQDILQGIYLVKERSARLLDLTMSFGERLSAFIISQALSGQGTLAEYLDASQLIKTDDHFGGATVNFTITNRNIKNYFEARRPIQIVTGFIASTEDNEVTTLGRGGSDYTAAIFAAALQCSEIEIWTDVDGVMTADPKKVPNAFPIESMAYEEAMEMSHFGSKVLHPKSMQPALEVGIPLRIRSTFKPEFTGTLISGRAPSNPYVISGISSISEISLLRVQGSGMLGVTGISGRLFSALAKEEINVILITQGSSEHSICFAVTPESAKPAKRVIEKEFALEIYAKQIERVLIEEKLSAIAVVGKKMRGVPGIAARIFHALGQNGINVVAIAQGSSELNISIVVNQSDESDALNAVHEAFFIKAKKTLHLYLVGVGLVGSELVEQIQQQAGYLNRAHSLEIKIHAIANSKRMIFDQKGLALKNWQDHLSKATSSMNLDDFAEKITEFNFRNSIFIDCTSSESVVKYYEKILNSGVSIVTPNKKATSSAYAQYRNLKSLASRRGVKFYYETNVGASLPIISTLNDLTLSGDKIVKIETIISGTISFIFNSFSGTKTFSEVVQEAKERGYTEPDPRDDLNGLDVKRKLLILAREVGLECESSQISVENILPESCQKAESIDNFFAELKKEDARFEQRRMEAEKSGRKLRYIATLEGEKTWVALQAVDKQHPFYHLDGNENIISITTNRYREKPLVIKGPGAGADVTAAGVFADIIRTAN